MRLAHLIFVMLLAGLFSLIACRETSTGANSSDAVVLAQTYCGSCHQYAPPELLDKTTWQTTVLPRMGYFMGIYDDKFNRNSLSENGPGSLAVAAANIFPEKPTISKTDWEAIQSFYLEKAPDQLDAGKRQEVKINLPGFEVKWPKYQLSPPSVTLVKIKENGFYIGDANTQSLLEFDAAMNLQKAAKVKEGAVWLEPRQGALLLTIMGSFSPTDASLGSVLVLPEEPEQNVVTLLSDLQRPVYTAYGDLNQDGRMDILVCEFGKWTGSLSWYEARPGQAPEKHVLRNTPGAIKAYLQDMNNDNLPDIVALFGQGDESIFVFYNKGEGQFEEQRLLRFPASYGSSFFALEDLNDDGHLDILYTAGDNADYSPVLKPYHGIYFFTNDGQNNFSQSFFFPLHGAYGAKVQDFDQDGDPDIAAISFFPDFAKGAREGFLYLQNQGDLQFKAYTFPEVADGRWIVMDTGDVDQDGDVDILLGSLTFEVVNDSLEYVRRWVEQGKGFVILENQVNTAFH